jgi:hypothetical protein
MPTLIRTTARPVALWRDLICPREHGSWSLAFEPIALGLLVAPSGGGGWLAVALAALFFARRPAHIALLEARRERRHAAYRALALCGAVAGAALALAAATADAGVAALAWLAPAALAGGIFAFFDARGAGREEWAELAGATAFALTPVASAALAGLPPGQALALGLLMTARAAPAVATVRAFLRAAKHGVRRDALALVASGSAPALAFCLAQRGDAPWFAVAALTVFALRTLALLVVFRPAWRARTLGMIETVLGVAYVAGLAVAWPV